MNYIHDENTLGSPKPLRVFNLETFGINTEKFVTEMRPTFSVLHLDPYDAKRAKVELLKSQFPIEVDRLNGFLVDYYANKADLHDVYDLIRQLPEVDRHEFDRIGMTGRRKRSVARFNLTRTEADWGWVFDRLPAERYQQKVAPNDPRALVRIFHEAEDSVTDHPSIRLLMAGLANMVRELHPEATKLQITLHQMFIFTDILMAGDNSPEGIHRDGADYIVSALVVERAGITGGESIVYGEDKETVYLRRTLGVGEGIFQDDRKLWHYVTPIRENPATPPDYGNRSIFGFDIEIVG